MSAVAEFNSALAECGEKLIACVTQLRDLTILEDERAIYKLGKAIAEINEVRTALYRIHPELKPELWDKPPSEEQYPAWFEEAKRVADDYCGAGEPAQAIFTLESFLFIRPTESMPTLVRAEVARVKREHGV